MGSIFSSLFGGSGGSSNTTTQNSTTSTHYMPEYEALLKEVISRATDASRSPYKKYDTGKMFQGFTGDQKAGQGAIRDMQDRYDPTMAQSKGALDKVAGYDPLAAAQPYLDEAGNSVMPWEAGSGAISQSMQGWNDPRVQASYMDPYTKGAIGRANELTERQFTESTMPKINSQFVGGGQLGRGNYTKFAGKAVRDLGKEMSGNAQTMMDKAYWSGAGQFNTDQGRLLNAGTAAGNLANQNVGTLSNLAKTNSDITTGAINTGMGLSNAYAQNAQANLGMDKTLTELLMKSGKEQQDFGQLSKTADYNAWMQEQARPFEMVNFLKNSVSGMNIPQTTNTNATTTQTGSSSSASSPVGTALGVGSAINSLFGTPGTSTTPGTGGFQNIWQSITGGPNQAAAGTAGSPLYGPVNPYQARGGRFKVRPFAAGGALRRPLRRYAVGGSVPVERGIMSSIQPPMPMGMPPMVAPGGPSPINDVPMGMGALPGGPPMPAGMGALGMMR